MYCTLSFVCIHTHSGSLFFHVITLCDFLLSYDLLLIHQQAIGCVLYELCVLKHAFDSNNLLGLVWKIVQEAYPPIPDMYSHDLRDLVSAMLAKDPAARPTVEQILDLKFIRRRLKVQIDERLRQRNLKRDRSTSSPTESTTNVFDNAMSVSGYEEVSQSGVSQSMYSQQTNEDGYDDDDTIDHRNRSALSPAAGGHHNNHHNNNNNNNNNNSNNNEIEYSRSSVGQFSKSTLMPSRPILGLHPNLVSSVSPKASPSNRSIASNVANRGSLSAGNTSAGSGKRLSIIDAAELNSSGSYSANDHDRTSAVVLGNRVTTNANKKNLISPKGRPGAFFPSSSPSHNPSSSSSSSHVLIPSGSSPGANRTLALPNSHTHIGSPRRVGDRDELAPSPSARSRIAQAEATRRIVTQDSFVDETGEADDVVDVGRNSSSAANSYNSYPSYNAARPSVSGVGGVRAPPPSQATRSYNHQQQSNMVDEDELAAALRENRIRDDNDGDDDDDDGGINQHDDGSDGLGESDPSDGESSDEDLVIEQLQSQLDETGDPNEADSPIYFLPDSSDEDGENDDENDEPAAHHHHHSHDKHQQRPTAMTSSKPHTTAVPQKKALPALNPSIKHRAANLLSTASSSSSSSHHRELLEPRAPPPQLSLRDKFNATKERCLRSISEKAFESLYGFFQHQLQSPNHANMPLTKPGTAFQYNAPETVNITNARLNLKKNGVANSDTIPGDLIFAIEQLAILQQMLDAPVKKK